MVRYVDRLANEWEKYGKIIVAVDFDDTISPWGFDAGYIASTGIVPLLRRCQEVGIYTVCFTACAADRHDEVRRVFESHGLALDSINSNPISLPYGNQNKIYANIFLDDRAGIIESLRILEAAMLKRIGQMQVNKTVELNDVA
jgi:hypothetical protein